MAKNGKIQQVVMRVLAVMLVASFLLAALSVVAQAWWYDDCRWIYKSVDNCTYTAFGYIWH